MFNPEEFLNQTVEGANDTKMIPVPVGEYIAIVEKVDVRSWVGKADPSKSGLALDILWSIDDQSVKDQLERDKVTVKQGIMLDLNDSGTLDMGKGKNIGLGKLREALELNSPGQPFSFNMLPGRLGRVSVTHRVDGENIFAEVKAVAKA